MATNPVVAALDSSYLPGTRVEHWFAGQGTVLRGWFHTAQDNVHVKWDKGGTGLAYKSECRIIRPAIDRNE